MSTGLNDGKMKRKAIGNKIKLLFLPFGPSRNGSITQNDTSDKDSLPLLLCYQYRIMLDSWRWL